MVWWWRSYLMYRTPLPRSALRCQPMGTWTGAACLSSPASQSFPPFIAPLDLRSTPQRYIYQTSTSVFAMLIMFVFQSDGGGCGWRRWVGLQDYALIWDSALGWSWWGGGWAGGRVGWGELTADPTLWAASWLQSWIAHGLPLLPLVIQSHPAEEVRIGSWSALCFTSCFIICLLPPRNPSLSWTSKICSTYRLPNAVGQWYSHGSCEGRTEE